MKIIAVEDRGAKMKPAQLMHVSELAPAYKVELYTAEKLTPEIVADAEIIFGSAPLNILPHAKSLRWLHLPSAGVDGYPDLSLYANRDIILTNSKGVYGVPISEHALSMMLCLSRAVQHGIRGTDRSHWQQEGELAELYGSTVLIAGLGDIGTALAVRLKGFNCRILGIKRDIFNKPECVDEVYTLDDLPQVLPEADYIVMCLPRTKETISVMNKKMLSLCKTGSIIVNVGRGDAIDTDALTDGLVSGRIRGAGLDVTEPEPLPDGHPLYNMPNVVLTPHVAGFSPNTNNRRVELFVDLLKNYLSGRRMYNQIDFLLGY